MAEENKLILITDILETRLRKQKELEFYQKELEKLQQKMFFIQKEIDITNICIKMVQQETVYDIRQNMIEKNDD